MKNIILTILCLLPLLCFADNSDLVLKYKDKFSEPGEYTSLLAFPDFDKEVPDDQKTDVLLKLMTLESTPNQKMPAQYTALLYCYHHDSTLKWTEAQEQQIYKLSESPDLETRILMIDFLNAHKSGRDRDKIVGFLNDSSDKVRYHAIIKISQLPNSKLIFLKYLNDNPDRKDSQSYKLAQTYSDGA